MDVEPVNVAKKFPILRELLECSRMGFGGLVKVASSSSRQVWEIYLYHGQIAWAAGGHDENRRWLRYIAQAKFPKEFDSSFYLANNSEKPIRYCAVMSLLQKQEISQEQAISLVENIVLEVVFDLQAQSVTDALAFSRGHFPVLNESVTLLNIEQVSAHVMKNWKYWESIGGSGISPNLLPIIAQPQKFKEMTPEKLYTKLSVLLDGKRSLRDLAFALNQDSGKLLQLLIPFYKMGIIDLVATPEMAWETSAKSSKKETSAPVNIPVSNQTKVKPLVACVDDSLRVCQALEKAVKQAGGEFLGIQDPLLALPLLIERKPQLIFLDVIMPVINGYELCSQIRRIPGFKETTIAILTGNDGVVDRVRAKMAGASCFVSKSGDTSAIIKILQQHCRSI